MILERVLGIFPNNLAAISKLEEEWEKVPLDLEDEFLEPNIAPNLKKVLFLVSINGFWNLVN